MTSTSVQCRQCKEQKLKVAHLMDALTWQLPLKLWVSFFALRGQETKVKVQPTAEHVKITWLRMRAIERKRESSARISFAQALLMSKQAKLLLLLLFRAGVGLLLKVGLIRQANCGTHKEHPAHSDFDWHNEEEANAALESRAVSTSASDSSNQNSKWAGHLRAEGKRERVGVPAKVSHVWQASVASSGDKLIRRRKSEQRKRQQQTVSTHAHKVCHSFKLGAPRLDDCRLGHTLSKGGRSFSQQLVQSAVANTKASPGLAMKCGCGAGCTRVCTTSNINFYWFLWQFFMTVCVGAGN